MFLAWTKVVHNFIEEEFLRSCAISYASLPETPRREGWGSPGVLYVHSFLLNVFMTMKERSTRTFDFVLSFLTLSPP